MKVGIGLPNAVAGTSGDEMTEFARRAEAQGFCCLGTIDRINYANWAPLIALAAAASATKTIELMTTVMLGPLRLNAVLTAKQALSVNQLSGGRLTLGIGLGARGDDYELSGVEYKDTAEKLEEMLGYLERTFDDDAIGPREAGVPQLLIGGHADASFERAARYGGAGHHGTGWIAGGAPPDQYAEMATKVRQAWADAGNEGEPRLAGLAYFALGDDAEADAERYLTDYYAFLGEETAQMVADGAATDPDQVKRYMAAFEEAGCGELIFFPSSADPAQADLLAEAIG
ncbi:MAG TPA: LLM class flavin-dependent oxidoreductase [Solirubrobacterales bacterium]|nr:LLM class flavin-dependent oxidoreductase [Solirubrobacterales bacterium]